MEPGVYLSSLATLAAVAIKSVGIYLAIIVLTRFFGLRSFSKLSSYDFAVTIAIGSVVATAILSTSVSLSQGLLALVALYLLQSIVGNLRVRGRIGGAVDNLPLLVIRDGEVLEENLRKASISVDDLRAKLRDANVLQLEHAKAVIFESTGDVSVLHDDSPEAEVQSWLLEDVRGVD